MSKDWTGNASLYLTNHRKKEEEVAEYDLYCTHPDSIKIFLKKAKEEGLIIPHKIWEPASGLNSIVDILVDNGYDVLATDLVERGYNTGGVDFLKETRETCLRDRPEYLKCIFTNPPYASAQEFVKNALEVLDSDGICIMFLKLTFLEGKKRSTLFKNKKLKYVWIYSERQGCGKNMREFKNGGAAAYAMFIWDNSYNGLPQINWM